MTSHWKRVAWLAPGLLWAAIAQGAEAPPPGEAWRPWITAHRHGFYHDQDADFESLLRIRDRALQDHDAHRLDLALGRLVIVASWAGTADVPSLEAQVARAIPAARRAGDDVGLFALLLGEARTAIDAGREPVWRADLAEADRIAARHPGSGMQPDADYMRLIADYLTDDAVAAEADAIRILGSDADADLKREARLLEFMNSITSPHQTADSRVLQTQVDDLVTGIDRDDEPQMALLIGCVQAVLLVRQARYEPAVALLTQLRDVEAAHPRHLTDHFVEKMLATALQDQGHWRRSLAVLEGIPDAPGNLNTDSRVHRLRALAYLHLGDPRALGEADALTRLLAQAAGRPFEISAINDVIAKIQAAQGHYHPAYEALRRAQAADIQRFRLGAERTRQQLRAAYDLAQNERENARLKARQAALESRRSVLLAGLGSASAGLLVAGALLLVQVGQRRRLATLSITLETANTRLQAANDALTTLHASRTRLLAAACHDLRQPAHALGLIAGAATEQLPPDVRPQLDAIGRCCASLTDMLEMLLDMTRLESDRYEPAWTVFPLDSLLREMQVQFALSAQRKGLAFTLATCDAHVLSDRHLLRRMLLNLLSNAVRYTPAGSVRLEARREGSDVLISVSDTGQGIPPERQRDIFEEHTRLVAADDPEGLGLGLAIVQRAAELLRHPLTLESTVGTGSCFTVRVPGADPATTASRAGSEARGLGQCVAIVDDDDEIRAATAALLAVHGFETVAAAGPEDLPARLAERGRAAPDLLLTDLHLHQVDGLRLIERLRTQPAWEAVPCIVVTGDADEAVAARAAALGAALAYKPLSPQRLLELIVRQFPAPRARP